MTARFAFGCYSKTPEARGLIKNKCLFGVKLWRLQAQPNSCLGVLILFSGLCGQRAWDHKHMHYCSRLSHRFWDFYRFGDRN